MNKIDLYTVEGIVRYTRIIAWFFIVTGLTLSSSWAEQEPTATPPSRTQPAAGQENSAPASTGKQGSFLNPYNGTLTDSDQPPVRQLGSAALLTDELSRYRWGSVFLRSVEFLQAFSEGTFGRGRNPDVTTSLFHATVAFDKTFRSSRLALQYRPFVGISNGSTYSSFSNRGVDFQTDYNSRLSPLWSMSIAEALAYHGAGNQYIASYFDVDTVTATAVHNNFLEGPFESLLSSTSLSFVRALSPRTHFSFGPQFSYGYSGGGYQLDAPISSSTYGGLANLEHALSPTRTIGVFYSFQRINASRTFANTTYQTAGGTYSQQLARTLRVSFSLGVSKGDFLGRGQLSANGNFNLTKAFEKSYLSLTYSQGHALSSYINNGETQRADLGFGFPLKRRMGTQFAAGYENTTSRLLYAGAPVKVSGAYASAQVNYQLFRNTTWFASYVRRRQSSYDLQIFPGSRDLIATGINWSPGANSASKLNALPSGGVAH
jgi:hypothetical protein